MNKSFATIIWNLLTVSLLMSLLLESIPAATAEPVSPEAKTCFEWFNGLGFPDVKGCQFVCVTEKWSDPKGKWPTQSKSKNTFLLTGDQKDFMVLDLELFRRSYHGVIQKMQMQTEASYKSADLKSEANSFLNRIETLKHGEDLFPRLEERISKRAFTFIFAWACWRNGLEDEAEKLYQASKHLRYGIEEVDENNFKGVLEQEISYAVMWRAVMDFGNVSISRPKLLSEFQNFIKRYPHSSYQERAKQTAEMLSRMIAEDEAHAKTAPTNLAVLPVEEQVRELIFQLRDQHGEQGGQPDWCDIFSDWRGVTNTPAHQLVKIGYLAVPQLIAALEDPKFTRSVGYWRDFTFSHNVLTVGDCAMQILGRITGKSFYVPNHTAGYMSTDDKVSDTKKRAEDWWNDFQKNGEFAMLAAGTEAGDNNSPEQAARLLRRFPKQALPTIEKAIQRATNGWIRPRLVQVLADDSSSAAIKILQREAVAGLDVSRAAAADILLQNGWTNIVDTMVNVWMTNADYFPENDSGLLEVPKFLVRSDSPQAIAALCENLSKRPLSSRMALVEIVGHGGTSYGEIRSLQERAAAAHPAMEHFLVKTLADDGRQFRPGGNDLDPRVGDTAAVFLHRFWPERYEFDASAPIEKRNQQRVVCQNVWRKAHGQTELPLPSSKRVKPTEAVMNKVSVVQWLPGSMKPSPGIAQCITNFTNANLSATNFAAVLSEFFNNPPLDASGLEIELERNPDFPGVKMFINLMPGHLLKKRESVLAIHSVSLAGAGLSFGNHEINREMYFMSPDWDGFISAVGEVFSAPAEKPFKVRWRICPEMSF